MSAVDAARVPLPGRTCISYGRVARSRASASLHKKIVWFATWEAWQHHMNLREVDCILYRKNEVDFTSLPDAFLRSREEQPITWQQLVQLVPTQGAYCEVTVPSWAEAQPWKTKKDKTEKIIWLHGLARKSGMSVVLLFNGSSPQNPPVEQKHFSKMQVYTFLSRSY